MTHHSFTCLSLPTCLPPSHIHCLSHFHTHTQQMIDELKLADRRYKEEMPAFARMKNKYDRMKASRDQAAKEAIEHKKRVALLESQLQECQKVLSFVIQDELLFFLYIQTDD